MVCFHLETIHVNHRLSIYHLFIVLYQMLQDIISPNLLSGLMGMVYSVVFRCMVNIFKRVFRYICAFIQNFPALRNISLDMDKPSRLLNTYLSENGIPFVDILLLFYDYERAESKPLYFKNDIHLNEQGHKLVAQILLKSLLSERILKDGIIWDY